MPHDAQIGDNCGVGILKKLFIRSAKHHPDLLTDAAQNLCNVARLVAVESFSGVSHQGSLFENVKPDEWDFFVTIGGVFIASAHMHFLDIPDDEKNRLSNIIFQNLAEWNQSSTMAYADCKEFYEDYYERLSKLEEVNKKGAIYIASNALGLWVVWNLLDHRPTKADELKLANDIGSYIISSFSDYWTTAK